MLRTVDPVGGGVVPSATDVLVAEGYDVFVYNYGDAEIRLECNARGVLGAILDMEASTNVHWRRVLGISMGGVVSRYALSWAEDQGIEHYCDMFISADSPQQGAWLNTTFQSWLKGMDDSGNIPVASQYAEPINALLLDSCCGRTHMFNKVNLDMGVEIEGNPEYLEFYLDLNNLNTDPGTGLGGYPQLTVNIGLSNAEGNIPSGSMTIPSLSGESSDIFIPGALRETQAGSTLLSVGIDESVGPLTLIPILPADTLPGSLQPAFKSPISIVEPWEVFPGLGPFVDPISFDLFVEMGNYGAPGFIWASSSLDLWEVDYGDGTLDASSIYGWGFSKFDHIYMIPVHNNYPSDRNVVFHDVIHPNIMNRVLRWLGTGSHRSADWKSSNSVWGIVYDQDLSSPDGYVPMQGVNVIAIGKDAGYVKRPVMHLEDMNLVILIVGVVVSVCLATMEGFPTHLF